MQSFKANETSQPICCCGKETKKIIKNSDMTAPKVTIFK